MQIMFRTIPSTRLKEIKLTIQHDVCYACTSRKNRMIPAHKYGTISGLDIKTYFIKDIITQDRKFNDTESDTNGQTT
jgi:hypothetical protein